MKLRYIQNHRCWFVYVLRCADGSLYTGVSTDVEKRVTRHNAGTGAAYTRSHRPVTLIWQERADSESAAKKREAQIKKLRRQEKIRLIQSSTPSSHT